MSRAKSVVAFIVVGFGVSAVLSSETFAQSSKRSRDRGAVNKIAKGVTEASVESLWIWSHNAEGDSSASSVTVLAGFAGRRFIKDNFAVSLHIGALYKTNETESKSTGVTGSLRASYFQRLGEGMFLAPMVGIGGLKGKRTVPAAGGTATQRTIIGGTVIGGLPFAFYAWEKFNIRAGLTVTATFGSVTMEGRDDSESLVTIDGGFDVGASYIF